MLRPAFVSHLFCSLGFFIGFATIDAEVADGQSFELIEPSGFVTAHIEARPGQLVVYQSNGERITYTRDPRYDSRNRRLLGYYNTTLARILRFPASGSGRMQTADLDDPIVAYTTTRRMVRPVRVRGDWLPPAIPGPVFSGPAIPGPVISGPVIVPPPILPGYGVDPGPMIYGPNTQVFLSVAPQSVVLESRVVAKPDLPPAMVTLRNGGPRELQVTILDNIEPGRTQAIRLAPNASDTLRLVCDAGATRIEKVRVDSLTTGDSVTKEIESDAPPESRYRIVVHEIHLQSIAIDRTPGGNNAIEDINQTGQGIGQFDLPPGPELQSGTIDVYAAAKSQGNARSIAPILATEDDEFAPDPLEQAIIDARRSRSR